MVSKTIEAKCQKEVNEIDCEAGKVVAAQ